MPPDFAFDQEYHPTSRGLPAGSFVPFLERTGDGISTFRASIDDLLATRSTRRPLGRWGPM
jgi:hypothetical protein